MFLIPRNMQINLSLKRKRFEGDEETMSSNTKSR